MEIPAKARFGHGRRSGRRRFASLRWIQLGKFKASGLGLKIASACEIFEVLPSSSPTKVQHNTLVSNNASASRGERPPFQNFKSHVVTTLAATPSKGPWRRGSFKTRRTCKPALPDRNLTQKKIKNSENAKSMEAKIANTRVSSTMYILRRNSNRKLSSLSSVQKIFHPKQ